MSIRHMSAVWDDPYFGQGDKVKLLVALALADNARAEDGKAWPSIETISSKARTSVRGAQEALRLLEKDGKIRIENNAGMRGTNAYFLLINPAQSAPRTVCTPRKRAAEKAPEIPPEKPAAVCTQNRQEPSGTVNNHQETNSAHADFVKLWTDEYPNHHAGDKYVFSGGKDGTAVKALLQNSGLSPENLMLVAVGAWKNAAGFYCKSASALSTFNSNFNHIREEIKNHAKGTPANQQRTFNRNLGFNADRDYSKRPANKAPNGTP